ncbi:MAG: M48 family metallopeptidase [Candidatus Thorarchaeota archaeon]
MNINDRDLKPILKSHRKRLILFTISIAAGVILIPLSIGFLVRSLEIGLPVSLVCISTLAAIQFAVIKIEYKTDVETRSIEASFREYFYASLAVPFIYDVTILFASMLIFLILLTKDLGVDFLYLLLLAGNALIIIVDVGIVVWPRLPVDNSDKFRQIRPEVYPQIARVATLSGIEVHSTGFLPLSKLKVINAYQAGGIKKKTVIAISDYLEQILTKDELAAIVAHEIGHIKFRHLIKKVIILSIVPVVCLNFYVLDRLLNVTQSLDESLQILFLIAFGIFVIGTPTLVLPWILRRWETQADLYAARLVGAEVYATALRKLVDNEVVTWKIDRRIEYLLDHPSLHRRVDTVRTMRDESK